LDRASASGAEGCEFDPRRAHQFLRSAQKLPRRSAAKAGRTASRNRPSYDSVRQERMKFFYVYILESIAGGVFYVGFTEDLRTRFNTHSTGSVSHTAKHRPWRIK
jgi:hypothetical protein